MLEIQAAVLYKRCRNVQSATETKVLDMIDTERIVPGDGSSSASAFLKRFTILHTYQQWVVLDYCWVLISVGDERDYELFPCCSNCCSS